MARFTVLLPVHRPPALLPFAIETVLAQNLADLELLVVCDGAPEDTVTCARDYAARDARVRVHAFPKGERHGEAHRHAALAQATGRYVAHICDDDLWFPDHLDELEKLLDKADFGHVIHVAIHPDGRLDALASDLGRPEFRRRFLDEKFNRFGPTFCGYRMEAYRRLPEGWAPAPLSIWTDLHMWRKFLRHEGFSFATRMAVTAIHFPAFERAEASLEDRVRENRLWHARIRDVHEREEIVHAAWSSLMSKVLDGEAQIHENTVARIDLQAELAHLKAAHSEREAGAERTAAERDELQAEVARLLSSKSWRLTKPLRAVRAGLMRVGRARQGRDEG